MRPGGRGSALSARAVGGPKIHNVRLLPAARPRKSRPSIRNKVLRCIARAAISGGPLFLMKACCRANSCRRTLRSITRTIPPRSPRDDSAESGSAVLPEAPHYFVAKYLDEQVALRPENARI